MEDIRNFQLNQNNQEEYQSIKPTIKMPLLFLSNLFGNLFLWIFLGAWFGSFLISLGLIGLTIFIVAFTSLLAISISMSKSNLKKTEFKFYNNRIEYYEGFLTKNRKTINYENISNISQTTGIIEGKFNLGTIYIDTAGSSNKGHELMMNYLENSDQIYNWMSTHINKK